ncbi:MAG: phosphoenolpyruvate synthase [Candidatus Aminicenantes bacterium]|nr:phosphoenolpyruvate synthase [Candidatus Aminicenantes bacterium]NIM83716.1 phosphoenolpyruvate synthase [Candidatus Aminicenantes bacterium]NIN23141.1 phosphoenolpyruvate synthase [Candidatus Aminicenantes bacterium]NIN46868.1 phosphoenolpyruvate synthase [Candidatus Aminicenantes bacterium]NIN89790.1 phosphoenolpyruvate synthase [Candidatus Aminicenantes bacterium]
MTFELEKEDYEPQFMVFHDLMKFRVREILLVSSFYDAFVLEEDGGLSERIFSEYVDLNLRFIPRITRVSSAEEALTALEEGPYDMVITMTRISDMNPLEFGQKVKERKPGMPVVLLTYEWVDVELLIRTRKTKSIDKVFYWTGDTRILLAVIKYIEDLKNVDNDIQLGVRAILLIEDSPRYHSMFLPILYTEIMTQTRLLISEGVNDLHRLLRMRARPKILMAETYEEGKILYKKYKDNLLGVISDIRFPRKDIIDENAGFRFARKVKREIPDLPFLLQSSNLDNKEIAYKNGLDFLYKRSENLLLDLQGFILSNFGFGDFVFKNAKGEEIARARNLQEFEEKLQIVSKESIVYHGCRNHISIWLRARTEFEAAERLRPKKVTDFESIDELRMFILQEIQKLKRRNQMGVITDFGQTQLDYQNSFIRLGSGSMGGKARGIAFLNALLAKTRLAKKFDNVEIRIPHTFVICSEIFEQFVQDNDLQEFAIEENRNNVIAKKFLNAKLPEKIVNDLQILLREITYPLAVRSSSILEDSQMLPFAGLYATYMLPNNNPNFKKRFKQLCDAIKLVFASVFFKSPKEYVKNTNFRIEEEKMAVIIQQVVGQNFNNKFYPVISGAAQSYNFYPISHLESEDGVVLLALGLGILVAEGGPTYRVSPLYPEMNPPYSSAAEFMEKSQNYFYSLDLSDVNIKVVNDEKFSLKRCDLSESEDDGTLFFVGSTFSGEDNAIRDTLSIRGPRLVTFANILKYNLFPLADILAEILKIGKESFGSHIEMEFAVNIFKDKTRNPQFHLLQIRPMVTGQESVEVAMDDFKKERVLCSSYHSMGSGVFKDFFDVVFVDPDAFNTSKTRAIAAEVGEINKKLCEENRKYVLIGFGRWGTADPWLGIPVEWYQISNARMIIESNLDGFNVVPSQGSHFFHNLTSLGLGYFHISKPTDNEFIDWGWLKNQKPRQKTKHVKHVRFKKPLLVKINARNSQGVILKPA